VTEQTAPGRGRAPLTTVLLKAARPAALVLVLVFATLFVIREWDDLVSALGRLHWGLVAASCVLALASIVLSAEAWRALLAGLGSRLPVLAAGRIFFLGQLGKYVPGGVWPIVAQAELSREYGVPRLRSASTSLVHMLVTLVTGTVVAAAALTLAGALPLDTYWWVLVVGAAGAVALTPPAFNLMLRVAFRIIRRPRPEPVDGRYLAIACGWVFCNWLAVGGHVWLLASSLAPDEPNLFLLTTGAFALAWVAGFVVVVLPAGAGAREAALALVLAPVMTTADAVALALVSRVALLLCDFVAAGIGVAAERRHLGREGVARYRDDVPA